MNVPFVVSLSLHVLLIIGALIDIKMPSIPTKLENKSFAVFEYKEIGPTSKAPVISQNEAHVSNQKAKKQDIDASTKAKKRDQNEAVKEDKAPKKKEVQTKPKEKPKPTPKKEEPKKATNNKNVGKKSDKAVVNLKRDRHTSAKADPKAKKKAFDSVLDDAVAKGSAENTGVKAEEKGGTLTASEMDLVREKLSKCWRFPAGLNGAEDLAVDIKLQMNKDGTIKKAEIVDKKRMATNPNFKIAAENAYRAVMDPECQPLPLPSDKYEEWKELEITFDPKEMF